MDIVLGVYSVVCILLRGINIVVFLSFFQIVIQTDEGFQVLLQLAGMRHSCSTPYTRVTANY